MWCESRKTGTVVYRERYKDPLTEKTKIVSVTKPKDTPQNRNKAHRELSAKIEVLIQATQSKNVSVTLSQLQSEYLKAQALVFKQSTVKRNRIITSKMIELLGSDSIVDNLTAQYVNSMLLNSNKPISTINNYLTRFKAMLNWGYENDYHDNLKLISKLKLFSDTSQESDTIEMISEKYLEPEEILTLLDYMKKEKLWHWYYVTSLLVLTGLRLGELIALEITDIDMDLRIIHITKNYDPNNDIVTTPKNTTSVRDIHIQPDLYTELKKCMLWRSEVLLEKGFRTSLLVPNIRTGYYMNHRAYEKFFQESTEQQLGHRLTPHALRHTHASLLASNGMTPDEIARRLGHNKSTITKKIYIHVTKKIKQNDNNKLDQIKLFS